MIMIKKIILFIQAFIVLYRVELTKKKMEKLKRERDELRRLLNE